MLSTRIIVDLTRILNRSFSIRIPVNSTKHISPYLMRNFIIYSYLTCYFSLYVVTWQFACTKFMTATVDTNVDIPECHEKSILCLGTLSYKCIYNV